MFIKFLNWALNQECRFLQKENADLKKRILSLREKNRELKKSTRNELSEIQLLKSQLRIDRYRLSMKEERLNDLTILRKEHIRKAISAERDYKNEREKFIVKSKSAVFQADNYLSELKKYA